MNSGNPKTMSRSQLSKYGRSAVGSGPIPIENFIISHSYRDAGVVSMTKESDSRFFITLRPSAGWADMKYTAFGLVTKGMEFISNKLAKLDVVPPSNYPKDRVRIVSSGCYSVMSHAESQASSVIQQLTSSNIKYSLEC